MDLKQSSCCDPTSRNSRTWMTENLQRLNGSGYWRGGWSHPVANDKISSWINQLTRWKMRAGGCLLLAKMKTYRGRTSVANRKGQRLHVLFLNDVLYLPSFPHFASFCIGQQAVWQQTVDIQAFESVQRSSDSWNQPCEEKRCRYVWCYVLRFLQFRSLKWSTSSEKHSSHAQVKKQY